MADNEQLQSAGILAPRDIKSSADLTDMFERFKKARAKYESDWKLNLAFYRNKQWTYISRNGRLESLTTLESEMPRYRVRATVNQITPGVQSMLAKLTKTKPIMTATPQSGSPSDVKAAQLSEHLLEDWWVSKELGHKQEDAVLWALLAGQGWWKIAWDPHAGIPMRFTLNPETGEPITNDELIEMYKHQLEQMGLPREFSDVTTALGDVHVEALSPFQVYLDDAAGTFENCKVAVCEHYLTPDEIKIRWNKDVKPDSVPFEPDQSLPTSLASEGTGGGASRSVKQVLFGYFVPTPRLPKGRYVVWCTDGEEGNTKDPRRDNILYDGSWPYPFNELPLVKFPGISVPGALYDDAIVTAAVPLQKVINRTHSQIIEYKNITLRPQVWAPYGSVKEKVTNEPGAINQFQPVMGMRPEVQQPQPIPNYVFQMLEEAKMGLKELFGLTEVSEGSVPPNVEAGVAIDLLQEMSADRIAPQMRHIETALARAGKYMLTLAQKYYTEERTLRIHGSGGTSQVKKFKGADIASGIDVIAESGSGLPRTRAGRQARIDAFVDRGVIQPHQAWKYYDLADMRSVAKKYAADEDQAFREHEKINNGEPINAVAFEAAMQSVQQGINPDTGEAFTDPAEVEAVLQRAGLQPGPAENYAAHLDIHHDQIVSVEFEGLPTEVQKAYLLHYELTQAASKETAPIPEGQSPRVSLSMHGTLGPTVASKIMQQAGVDASPEEFLEQPLETLVMDSVDAPDRDEAANDPFTEEEKLNDMQIRADEHAVAMTKSAQDLAHAERKMQLTEETERAKAKAAAQRPSRPSGN